MKVKIKISIKPHWNHDDQQAFQGHEVDGQKAGIGRADGQHLRDQTQTVVNGEKIGTDGESVFYEH
jgi:hypothetical protein